MDGKAERTEGRQAHESYTMLLESDAIVRDHRTLRRELCISRMIIFIMLITCMVFCAVRYLQQAAGGQNDGIVSMEKATETFARLQAGDRDPNKTEVWALPTAFLIIAANWSSTSANLAWELYPENRCFNFSLNDRSESLVIPCGGWYRLGLQITYTNRKNSPKREQIPLAHHITKYSGMYSWEPVTILSVYETVYKKNKWYKSVFSEVVHVFGKGDKVTVKSDNALLVDSTGERMTKTFLTAQLISVIEDL